MFEPEGHAVALLRAQGFDPASPPSPEYLAYALLGARRVQRVFQLPVRARWRSVTDTLEIRHGATRAEEAWSIAHELAERELARLRVQCEEIEQLADALAAALVAPGPAVQRALKIFGRDLPALDEVLEASQSIVALRLGEVTGSPLALVTPRRVHVRGEEWGWDSPDTLRQLARRRVLPGGLTRARLTDAPRRVLLVPGSGYLFK